MTTKWKTIFAVGVMVLGQPLLATDQTLNGPVHVSCAARNFFIDVTYENGTMKYEYGNASGKGSGFLGPIEIENISSTGAKAAIQSTYDQKTTWLSIRGFVMKKEPVEAGYHYGCKWTRVREPICKNTFVPAHDETKVVGWTHLMIDVLPNGQYKFNRLETTGFTLNGAPGFVACSVSGI